MENKIIAKVDGREINEKHMSFLINTLGPQRMFQFQGEKGREKLIQELVNQELFYSYALKNEYEKEKDYLEEVEIVNANLLKSYAIRKFLNNLVIEESKLREYYENNKSNFIEDETVKASHILVSDEKKLAEIKADLEKGKEFSSLAKEHSLCPSKDRGGDLGFFTRGKMVPEFEEAAFSLEVGQVSEPVKTQFGYHLIRLDDKKPADQKEFEEVRSEIENKLLLEKQTKAFNEKIDELKSLYEVEIL